MAWEARWGLKLFWYSIKPVVVFSWNSPGSPLEGRKYFPIESDLGKNPSFLSQIPKGNAAGQEESSGKVGKRLSLTSLPRKRGSERQQALSQEQRNCCWEGHRVSQGRAAVRRGVSARVSDWWYGRAARL